MGAAAKWGDRFLSDSHLRKEELVPGPFQADRQAREGFLEVVM